MGFYKARDYPPECFRRAFRKKEYPGLGNKIKRIAVYKSGGGLGDLVQSIPLFRSLRRMFPDAKIIYLGLYQSPRCDTLFKIIPYIDEYIRYVRPGREASFKDYRGFLKKYRGSFDLIVDTQPKFGPSFYLWLLSPKYLLSRNPFFTDWRSFQIFRKGVHALARMLLLARILGFEEADFSPAIDIPQEYLCLARDYLKGFSGPFVSIQPGAGHPYKMWPKEKFAALADMFCSMGYRVILSGAESEKDLLLAISRMMKGKPLIPLVDKPRLGEDPVYSIGLFKFSALTVSNDCGGLHLATLAGCPVIGIYGPTSPLKFGPLGGRNVVIYKDLSCSPCRLRDCRIQRRCLQEITPEEVIEAANFILRDTL